jgi:methyl-accepting chemotaxis protein
MKNIKLTVRLIISVAVFLLPLGIMLFSIVSASLVSIRKDRAELNGVEVLHPAINLMQSVPQYINFYIDDLSGDISVSKNYTANLFDELERKYKEHFGNEIVVVSMNTLAENWSHLTNTRIRETVLHSYSEIMQDLIKLISYVGDISGLITDSEIEGSYLISSTVHELPQVQERMVLIGNILRTIEAGSFTQRRRAELELHLELLVHADNVRIQKRFNTIESFGMRNSETFYSFENLLKLCYSDIVHYSELVEYVINNNENIIEALPVLFETGINTNNSVYRLQSSALDRLETIIKDRINKSWRNFILSLAFALISTIFAFAIIIFTINYIRKSTLTIGRVFKRLDENDLTVYIESLSKDEMGVLMSALNGFLQKLNTAFISFGKNAKMVSTAALELSSSAQEITATANEQSANIEEIVKIMENIKELSVQAAENTTEVANLASKTQELSRKGADLSVINEDMMLDIRNQNGKIIDNIQNLADMLSRIDESIQLIDTIADRTKLIAFNAALEASSSGEAGARFSVVASEIRRFAGNVVESVSEIKEKISQIQEASAILINEANTGSIAIQAGYNRMLDQMKVFENIVDVSKNVADRSQQISIFSKQQEVTASQVFTSLKEISLGVNQFVTSSTMTLATVEKLNSMSLELSETIAKYQTKNRENL